MSIETLRRKNFTPGEFFVSEVACERNINNLTTDPTVIANLGVLADKIQEIRDLLKKPVKITSGYRCLDLNRAIGSRDTSQHILGQACDFICPKFGTPSEIIDFLIKKNVLVDQCLLEHRWIHLSTLRENRNQYVDMVNGKFKLLK